jgi:hypothetical protein
MLTYKDVVAKYKEKNSKTPKTTWRYESWGDSYEQDPRSGYQGGQLVDHGPGYKPGGLVEPGVTHYATLTEAGKAANIKTWEKNTGLKFKNITSKSIASKVRRGITTGAQYTKEYSKYRYIELLKNKDFKNYLAKDYPDINIQTLIKDLTNPAKRAAAVSKIEGIQLTHETFLDIKQQVPKDYIREQDLEKLLDLDLKKARGSQLKYFHYIEDTLGMKKIKSKVGNVTRYFYKKPSETQIKAITKFVDLPYLATKTLNNVNILAKSKLMENALIDGRLPKLQVVQNILKRHKIKATDSQVAKAVSTLGQLWRGDEFQNKIAFDKNKKLGNTIYRLFGQLDMTNPYSREMYTLAMQEVDVKGGNRRGTFSKWKRALNKELRSSGVPIYKAAEYNDKGKLIKKAVDGFNINEITSIKASARNDLHTYSYFIDLTKGDINQKSLARFQGDFSKKLAKIHELLDKGKRKEARAIIHTWNTEKVPNFKSVIAETHGIEAANNLNLPEIKYGTKIDPKIYTSSQLKKYKNYGIDIEGMAKKHKFYIDVKKAIPIQELLIPESRLSGKKVMVASTLDKFLKANLSDFCPKQKVASGGRIGFAGCTPQQILDNMKKDQQLLIEYKKGTKNISSAEAAKISQKFINASGKVLKLGAKGARVMFGPAMLWGEPLFEGAFVAHDMIGNKTPFAEAISKTYFAAPLKWAGILKEPEEYEAEALFQKKDNREFVYFDGKEIKNPNFGKVTGVIPGVKAYTDARSKLMKINDLETKISNFEKYEEPYGTSLGTADALAQLKEKLSKEMSDIRYDKKSLQNIMKKNEPEYNIAVEKQRAERFKDEDPYVPGEGDIGPLLDVTRNKRLEAMADVNRGYLQDEGAFGHYVSLEKYEQIKNLASQPGKAQKIYQKFKKQIDDMGGPGFGPYKETLKQPGFGGPANQYTYGQATTPADRYYLDRTGKIAEAGGVANLAAGGRVSFKFGKRGIDEGKRAFMKLLAALGIGTATIGTGLIKLGGKAVGKKAAVTAGVDIATSTPGMPSWFPALVNKIIKEGDDVTAKLATKEREIVHTKKLPDGESATIYRNTDTGDIRVEYDSVHNMGEGTAPVQMEYKAGQVIDEGKMAGKKTKPEFLASEVEPVGRAQGQDDYVIEWDGDNIVGNVDDLMSDTSKLKQFATKKKPTMKEIVTRKRKTDEVSAIHKNESDYIVNKQGDYIDYDDYLPDIDDID